MAPGTPLITTLWLTLFRSQPSPPRGREVDSTTWKEMEGQVVTYIGTFGAREAHDTRLPTSPLRTWRSRATVFTRGSLKEKTPFSEQTL